MGSQIEVASADKYLKTKSDWNPLSRYSIERMHEQAINYFRAVTCLCEQGWAHTVQPISKAILENLINAIVIVTSDSEFRAFKFIAHEHLLLAGKTYEGDNEMRESKDRLDDIKKQLRETTMTKLSADNQKRANIIITLGEVMSRKVG